MKKVLVGIVALVLIVVGGGYACYHTAYGGDSYYVHIQEDGVAKKEKDDSGQEFTRYYYTLTGYDEKGEAKEMNFTGDHNLRHDAYLRLVYNDKKGVTSWEEVQKQDIPQKALNKI